VPAVPAGSLETVTLTGTAATSSTTESVAMTVGTTLYVPPLVGTNYFPDLAGQWNAFEFNVFGNGGGSEAVFGSGTTLVVRDAVPIGTPAAPGYCVLGGYSLESNNLTLVATPPTALPGAAPALVFSESVQPITGTNPSCADATSLGDTHLTTFDGLYYDFQATGDFVLADDGPAFTVQNRQVSGAPTWPNAAVNSAVGVRIGRTTVAICLPGRLEIDGQPVKLDEGASRSLAGAGIVTRAGDTYVIVNERGDSLRAQVNDGWINASVGLGRWPSEVRGLLANAEHNPHRIATRDGAVLTEPVSFENLYHRYGKSWRVRDGESILCGENVKTSFPTRPFYARDLDSKLADRARQVCSRAGVRKAAQLDSCILDVAVIGKDAAADVFATQHRPVVLAPP
jgi:hypothetical protein